MEIVRLPVGQAAPAEADCITIDHIPGEGVNLIGTALCGDESVALMGRRYPTRDIAEEQGIAWAHAQGVELLYIATDAPVAGD